MLYSTPKPENLAIVPYWRRLEREKQETRRLYFRLGWISPREYAILELRYNENHDPENGRFTSGPGGAGGGKSAGKAPSSSGQKTDSSGALTNAAGMPVVEVNTSLLEGPPNGITQKTNAKGGIDRNYYDTRGRRFKQISNKDHGNPKRHPFGKHGEHAHDYQFQDGEPSHGDARELTEQERKENSDIL